MTADTKNLIWKRFTLREAIWLGFCATFIIISRVALMLHLNIPGHAMFFIMFFLILGRGCVPRTGAATLVGLIAGIISTMLGMGKEGPLIIIKFVLPGIIVDAGGILYPRLPSSYTACIVTGIIASACRYVTTMGVDWVVGMDPDIILKKAVIGSVMNILFGALGAALVPPVIRKLKANGLI